MGTLTINTTAAQDQRLAKAFGAELELGQNANAAQIKGAVIAHIKQVVKRQELKAATLAANAIVESITEIDVS